MAHAFLHLVKILIAYMSPKIVDSLNLPPSFCIELDIQFINFNHCQGVEDGRRPFILDPRFLHFHFYFNQFILVPETKPGMFLVQLFDQVEDLEQIIFDHQKALYHQNTFFQGGIGFIFFRNHLIHQINPVLSFPKRKVFLLQFFDYLAVCSLNFTGREKILCNNLHFYFVLNCELLPFFFVDVLAQDFYVLESQNIRLTNEKSDDESEN